MSFIGEMHTYFRGEKVEAFWFILPIGILLCILGAVALRTERGGFALGTAMPCFLFGLILMGTGIGVGSRTDGQVAEIERAWIKSPAAMAQQELIRMDRVNANFRLTFIAFGVLVAVGLMLHYLGGANWGRGLGAVLILVGAIGLLIDGFAERRAAPYTAALQEIVANRSMPSDSPNG